MPNQNGNQGSGQRGGSHEQHVKAGEQSHKNDDRRQQQGSGERGGSRDQNAKSGQQSRKDD